MPILETIVCQTMKGKEARFERMVKRVQKRVLNFPNGSLVVSTLGTEYLIQINIFT